MAATKIDWSKALRPLLAKYKNKKHPLEHGNAYQLLVMVVLSAQSRDDVINKLAPSFFTAWPDMTKLATATPEKLFPYLAGVRNFGHKAGWLVSIAQKVKSDKGIPDKLKELVELPGIGRKSANVILREMGRPAEGVIVDIHVIRVAPRLGIVKEEDPNKIEEKLMKILPADEWDAGMCMSFLGREICLPKPKCDICLMNTVCAYYSQHIKKATKVKKVVKKPKKSGKKPKGVIK